MLRPLPLLDPPEPPPKKVGILSSEGEGEGVGVFFVGDKAGDRKEDGRGGEGGLADEECLLLVRSLVTEAVAWEVLASGKLGGANSRGGGRVLEPVVEVDTAWKQMRSPEKLSEARLHIHDLEAESCLSLSIASAWSSMKILLNDVTAKFVCVSLSEELLAEDGSSIGGVSGFDERTGEFDWESGRVVLRGVKDLPLDISGAVDVFVASGRVGLARFRVPLVGEVKDRLRAILLNARCGVTYDDKISYARTAGDNSGVRVSALCPLLKLVRLDEAGEGEADEVVGWNR